MKPVVKTGGCGWVWLYPVAGRSLSGVLVALLILGGSGIATSGVASRVNMLRTGYNLM